MLPSVASNLPVIMSIDLNHKHEVIQAEIRWN